MPGVYSAPVTRSTRRGRASRAPLLLALGAALAAAEAPRPRVQRRRAAARRHHRSVRRVRRQAMEQRLAAAGARSHRADQRAGRAVALVGTGAARSRPGRRGPAATRRSFASCSPIGSTRTASARSACAPTTGRRPPLPPPTEQPYPKDGLVVSPPQPVERSRSCRRSPRMRAALSPALHEAFNKAEREIADAYGHPVSRRAREGRAPDIEAVYAVGDHPRIYYVEATRRYRQLGQRADECEAVGVRHRLVRARRRSACVARDRCRSAAVRSRRRQLHAAARRDAGRRQAVLARAVFRLEPRAYVVVEIKPRPWKRSSACGGDRVNE